MSTTDTYLKAILNRIKSRAKLHLGESLANINAFVENTYEKLRQQLTDFQKEVVEEVERMDREVTDKKYNSEESIGNEDENALKKIDQIREKILIISQKLEKINK